jgi:hypothetical protein
MIAPLIASQFARDQIVLRSKLVALGRGRVLGTMLVRKNKHFQVTMCMQYMTWQTKETGRKGVKIFNWARVGMESVLSDMAIFCAMSVCVKALSKSLFQIVAKYVSPSILKKFYTFVKHDNNDNAFRIKYMN